MSQPLRPTTFYHGTSVEAALAIQEQGFDPERSGSNAGKEYKGYNVTKWAKSLQLPCWLPATGSPPCSCRCVAAGSSPPARLPCSFRA